jgi:hypothetical protein
MRIAARAAVAQSRAVETWHVLIATAGTYLLAGFIKGVIGLGLPTVAVGLLGLMMSPAQAAAILVVPSLVTNVWQCFVGGAVLGLLRRLASLLVGICVGTVIAAVFFPPSRGEATIWLGAILALYAVLGLLKVHFKVPRRAESWLGIVIGVVNGVLSVATSVFVIPAMPYLQSLDLDRDRLVQALGLSFTVSTITLAVALAHAGQLTWSLWLPSAVALVTAIVGMVIGQAVRGRISPTTFRLCLFLGLLALGLHLALRQLL